MFSAVRAAVKAMPQYRPELLRCLFFCGFADSAAQFCAFPAFLCNKFECSFLVEVVKESGCPGSLLVLLARRVFQVWQRLFSCAAGFWRCFGLRVACVDADAARQ